MGVPGGSHLGGLGWRPVLEAHAGPGQGCGGGQVVGGDLFGRVIFCIFELLPGFCDGNFEHAPWPELKIEPTPSLPLPAEFDENFMIEEELV